MNDNLKSTLASVLKIDAAVLDESDETKVQSVVENLNNVHIFTTEELNSLKANSVNEAVEKLSDPKKELPAPIYNRVKGTILEQYEGRLKKKFGYSGDYSGIEDLFDKIVNSQVETVKNDGELQKENQRLKDLVKKNDKDWEEKLLQANSEKETYIIKDSLRREIKSLPLDYPESELPDAYDHYETLFLAKNEPKLIDGKIIVSNRANGQTYKDKVGDPMPLLDVLKANKPPLIKFKDITGGRGDQTKPPVTGLAQIKTGADMDAYLKEKGISPTSKEAQDVLREVIKLNPEFKIK